MATSVTTQPVGHSKSTPARSTSWLGRIRPQQLPTLVTACLLVVLYVAGLTMYESFASLRFMVDLFKGNAAMGICAVGMTFVIISGGIDLSVGSVVALGTVVSATAIGAGVHPVVAMLLAIVCATAVGVFNGFFIHEFRLPAFLVTLATMFFARGLSFAICPEPISIEHPALEWLMDELGFSLTLPGLGRAWVPPTAYLLAGAVIVAIVVSRWTGFGRNTFALGGSPGSALLMGVPIRRTTFGIYALSGACAGLAGVATVLTDSAGKPNIGVGLELEAIAAVVIGGTLLTGGSGTVIGTLMGVLITAIVRSVIILDGSLSSPWQPIAIALLLLVFIVLQRLFTSRIATPS